jgi:hypothetical protein
MYVTHDFQKMTNRKMCVRWCKETNGKTTALVGTPPSAKWQRKCQKSAFSSGIRPHSANSNWLAEGASQKPRMKHGHNTERPSVFHQCSIRGSKGIGFISGRVARWQRQSRSRHKSFRDNELKGTDYFANRLCLRMAVFPQKEWTVPWIYKGCPVALPTSTE